MAVSILEGFDYGGNLPNFSRDLFETVADMVAFSEDYLPPVFECNVQENGKRYRYNVSNSVDPELGKWREASSGDADLSNYYTKKEIDENIIEPLEEKVDANAENIGDLSTLEVATWTDLVTAVNGLYNSLLSSITYTVESSKKILRLTYRNSETKDIDISAIVGEVKLSELSDVDSLNVLDGNVLAYDNASSKFKPKDLKLGELLQTAKDYTDEQIAESEKASAMDCDEKPVYDDATGEITYISQGVTYHTKDTNTWFYYKTADTVVQTRWINGVEFTIDLSNINLDDYVKTNKVAAEYTGDDSEDKTKVATLKCLDDLKGIISDLLADKVNVSDIVDNLTSTDTDKPLSANQGKELKDLIDGLEEDKLSIQQDEELKGKIPVVGEDGKLTFQEGSSTAENVSYENENYPLQTNVKKALDAIWAKLDYVKPEITSFTMDPATTEYEVGQEVTEIDFAWTYNKDVTSQSLSDVSLTDEKDRSAKWTGSLKTTKTFTLSCGDGENSASATKTISFKNKIYWGSAAIPEEFNSAFILGLSKNQFATSYKGKYNVTVGSGEYAFVCCPASWNMPNICKIGGFGTDLVNVGEFSFTNASGGTSSYKIVRTTHEGLGAIEMLFE
ncbi:MAG: hypothetical protein MJ162_07315 [Treponema sp.]|nr:hypothetical protein [Treponema sp.]